MENRMSELLWIGSYLDDNTVSYYQQLGYKNPASILSQKNILEGIEAVVGKSFNTINILSFVGYPFEKKILMPGISFAHKLNAKDLVCPVFNIRYINKFVSRYVLKKEVKRFLDERKIKKLDVFIYEMRSCCMAAVKVIKKEIPCAKIHMIVPDLPQYMDLQSSRIKKILKAYDWKFIEKHLNLIDDFILYSSNMARFLNIKDNQWLLMEGSLSEKAIQKTPLLVPVESENQKIILMYSGAIKKEFGIPNLLNAFQYLNNDYQLWITGTGDFEQEVIRASKSDDRIRFFGYLPSYSDLLELQRKADIMINMRDPYAHASDYCFPSKLFEYMLTGKPVITPRLGGIPKEYYSYLIVLDDIDPKTIASKIEMLSSMSKQEKDMLGLSARKYIMDNKTSHVQAKRIVEFTHIKEA